MTFEGEKYFKMLLGSVQIAGEQLGELEINDICESLKQDSIRLLSLRGCKFDDDLFKKLMNCLKTNGSLVHLNLNLGVVATKQRIKWLAEGLMSNKSVQALFLHGNPLGDEGIAYLTPALMKHPNIQSLDLGDCQLGDESIRQICALLPPEEGTADITDLTLTANMGVTPVGWTQLAIAIAASSRLKTLFLDYNRISDYGAGVLSVALASSNTLEMLDLEGTGITEIGAELFFDVVANYPTRLKEIVLTENNVSEELQDQIKECLDVSDESEEQSSVSDHVEELSKESPQQEDSNKVDEYVSVPDNEAEKE